MKNNTYKVIGLMSGSSLDGLDMVCAEYTIVDGNINWKILAAETAEYDPKWYLRLKALDKQYALPFVQTHTYFGHYMGDLVNEFIQKYDLDADFIASHGHTIFHYPHKLMSIQIGDGAALAVKTGLPVICDFRTTDIALEGEGAPLAPLADKWLFDGYDFYLNLGGIANIGCFTGEKYVAFDVGPCNQVLNRLAKELDQPFDDKGELARSGKPVPEVLDILTRFKFFKAPYPKSLNNQWIRKRILPIYFQEEAPWEDMLYTATKHTAAQIGRAISEIVQREGLDKESYTLLATGGGVFNTFLMESIQASCKEKVTFEVPEQDIVNFKEALLIGLLGVLRLNNEPNSMKTVTNAKMDSIGGAIYQGTKKQI